jgi:predicted nucleic acid-binding protein
MILYLDTSALAKRYLAEVGGPDVRQWISQARPIATGIITRAELAAAIHRAGRLGWINAVESAAALSLFRAEWDLLGRLPVSEATVRRADELAGRHGLRGFDAIHLACALLFQEALGEAVTMATYDRLLWQAASAEGLAVLPVVLS